MIDFLSFYWRSILAAAMVGAAAPAIGAFVVQKRLSLIGDGIGHIAFAGVAVGLWAGVSPLAAALAFAVLGAIAIDRLRGPRSEEADMILALFFYGALALAVVVASATGSFNVNLFGILFGQVLTVTMTEMVAIAGLALVVLGAVAIPYRGLVATAVDEEAAIVAGVPVRALNTLLMVTVATTVGVGMRVVGVLLVAALMVLPVGIARNLVRSFRATILAACAAGALSAFAGIALADRANTAVSGTIVVVAVLGFLASAWVRALRVVLGRRRERRAGSSFATVGGG